MKRGAAESYTVTDELYLWCLISPERPQHSTWWGNTLIARFCEINELRLCSP